MSGQRDPLWKLSTAELERIEKDPKSISPVRQAARTILVNRQLQARRNPRASR